ncbi:MAG: hypothetical protein ACFCUG_15810 [Thiotrichales bacterium]
MSVTTRSTMIGVSPVFTSLNSAVSAALPRSSSSSGGTSFSACRVSLAISSNCFRNSTLLICPDSKRSVNASNRAESCLKLGLPACPRKRRRSLISISLPFFGSGFDSTASVRLGHVLRRSALVSRDLGRHEIERLVPGRKAT